MSSRNEELLEALLNGEASDIVPRSRNEELLLASLNGEAPSGTPQSRMEAMLYAVAEKGLGDGSGVVIKNQPLTVTENGTYRHATGYTGLGTVTVNVPIPEAEEPTLQDLTVTENGTYTPGEGVDGFGKVTVNVESESGDTGETVDAEKLDLYERYLRACNGVSHVDWPETVTTRGMQYTQSQSISCAIYPEMDISAISYGITNMRYFKPGIAYAANGNSAVIVDMSRLSAKFKVSSSVKDAEIIYHEPDVYQNVVFAGLPDFCRCPSLAANDTYNTAYSQGISFGKYVSGMSANSIVRNHTANGDKPVTVMEGFTGNLYLAKLNISAEHLIGIINNLGEGSYKLNIGSHNTAKLTAEQIAVATEKGWTVT